MMLQIVFLPMQLNNPRNTYEVKPGDTLWKVASTDGTTEMTSS